MSQSRGDLCHEICPVSQKFGLRRFSRLPDVGSALVLPIYLYKALSTFLSRVLGNDIRNFVPTCQKSLFGARPRPDDRAHARTRRTHDDAHPTHMTAQAVVGLVRDVRGVVGVVRRVTRKMPYINSILRALLL